MVWRVICDAFDIGGCSWRNRGLRSALDTTGDPKESSIKVLTVFANPNPKSFCHAILERFSKGLEEAGHTSKRVDLYVITQWEKVKNAQGLAFIAPVYWCHFPAIIKGWFERGFAYSDAYALTPEGWRGEMKGRVPLLQHEKALIINTTLFSEEDYQAGLEKPMTQIIDNWGRYPGVKKVEHVYFLACKLLRYPR